MDELRNYLLGRKTMVSPIEGKKILPGWWDALKKKLPSAQQFESGINRGAVSLGGPSFSNWTQDLIQDVKKRGLIEGAHDLLNPLVANPRINPIIEPIISNVRMANYKIGRPNPIANALLGMQDEKQVNPNANRFPLREGKRIIPPPSPEPTPTPDPFIEKGWEKTGKNSYRWPTPTPTPTVEPTPRAISGYQNWVSPDIPFEPEIEATFGAKAKEAKQVLKHLTPEGEIKGENTQFVYGPEGDWTGPETGITDRGLYRVASSTFDDFMARKPKLLKANDIQSYDDMLDPIKNIKMAKIIYDEQGWRAWIAAPSWLRGE